MTDTATQQPTRRSGAPWKHGVAVRPSKVRTAIWSAVYGLIAVAAISIGSIEGNVHSQRIEPRIVIWSATVVFFVFGIAASRRLSRWLEHSVGARSSSQTASAFRVVAAVIGYVVVIIATLGLISVPIGHLLVGGAIIGVVVGIAAQQALGNLFAGIVLLLARPFRLGDHIRIRSGALGGEFDGVVRAMNLTYVMVRTEQGLLHVPNSSVLAAAVGPWKRPVAATTTEPLPLVTVETPNDQDTAKKKREPAKTDGR
jgi:small-conductance mechanosensitive channel